MKDIHVLIIDDNPAIHIDFSKILNESYQGSSRLEELEAKVLNTKAKQRDYNFILTSAYQGEEGLTIVRNQLKKGIHYTLAFIDIRMPPGQHGLEVAKELLILDPDIQIVICTAYSDFSWHDFMEKLGLTDRLFILKKPFENIEVLQLGTALAKKWERSIEFRVHENNLNEAIKERTTNITKLLAFFRATLEATTDSVVVLNKKNIVMEYNKKFENLFSCKQNNIRGKLIEEIIKNNVIDTEKLLNDIKNAYINYGFELHGLLHTKDNRIVEYFSAPQLYEEEVNGIVLCFRESGEGNLIDTHYKTSKEDSSIMENQNLIMNKLKNAIISAKKYNALLAVLYIDLDGFKRINECYGPHIGNLFLKLLENRLKENIRYGETIVRFSHDKFVLIVPSLRNLEDILPICESVLKNVSEPILLHNQYLALTCSIGISLFPKDGDDAQLLIKYAEIAKNAVKTTRNAFQFFTMELNVDLNKRMTLEADLKKGLANNEFVLEYQPIIDCLTGGVIGFEALLRWHHPKLGLIMPEEFIPIANETNLINDLGNWVMETACLQNKQLEQQGYNGLKIAINIASKQLEQPNFVEIVANILEQTGQDPSCFELELTETTLVEGSDKILRTIHELKTIGISIVIDDFGVGYSNLKYLHLLPIDKIKIDRSFINLISPNPQDTAIILAIISVAKNLNVTVLAEGVEKKDQVKFLQEHHCDELQGYYFSKAVPAANLINILQKQFISTE